MEQFIEDQENENTRKKTQQNAEKSSLSQVSESPTTTVHSASSAADYQQGQQAMSIFTGAVIHGGQFNISISSLNQLPTLATPETEIKSTNRCKRLKMQYSSPIQSRNLCESESLCELIISETLH